eukprot:2062173-Lingulodinium_polyedra.AAC.1
MYAVRWKRNKAWLMKMPPATRRPRRIQCRQVNVNGTAKNGKAGRAARVMKYMRGEADDDARASEIRSERPQRT